MQNIFRSYFQDKKKSFPKARTFALLIGLCLFPLLSLAEDEMPMGKASMGKAPMAQGSPSDPAMDHQMMKQDHENMKSDHAKMGRQTGGKMDRGMKNNPNKMNGHGGMNPPPTQNNVPPQDPMGGKSMGGDM